MAFSTALFHISVNLSGETNEHGISSLFGFLISFAAYVGSVIVKLYSLWIAAIACMIISLIFAWPEHYNLLKIVFEKLSRPRQTFRVPALIYPAVILTAMILWIIFNHSDNAIREQDYAFEGLILLCVGFMWATT